MSNNITTPALSTGKKVRFYSKEENRDLAPFIKEGQQPTAEALKDFCAKYNRNLGSVQVRIYTLRRDNKKKKDLIKGDVKSPKASLTSVKDKSTVNLSKGEFKIPISNWNVSNENGQFYFVVKF